MRRSQLTRSLHMPLQIPVPLQGHPRHIHNIRTERNRRSARILAIRQLRTQRLCEARQILIQRGQVPQLAPAGSFVNLSNRLEVEMANLKQVNGDAAPVAPACPLWVETAGGFVGFDVDGVVELVDAGFFAPGFGVCKLRVGRR